MNLKSKKIVLPPVSKMNFWIFNITAVKIHLVGDMKFCRKIFKFKNQIIQDKNSNSQKV